MTICMYESSCHVHGRETVARMAHAPLVVRVCM